jgi:hypothetical protein
MTSIKKESRGGVHPQSLPQPSFQFLDGTRALKTMRVEELLCSDAGANPVEKIFRRAHCWREIAPQPDVRF